MDFAKALTFTFRERNWIKKVLITGIISIIPIIGAVYLMGWILDVVRRVRRNELDKLPESFSFRFFQDGLRVLILLLVYSIPLWLFLISMNITVFIWQTIFNGFIETLGVQFFNLLINLGKFVYLFVLLLILPALINKLLNRNSIRNALEFKSIYQSIRGDIRTFTGLLVAAIICIIVASLGISFFYVGIILTLPIGAAAYASLVGDERNLF